MAQYVLAIDQGTTSTRAIVFDHAGAIVSVGQKEHEQIFPRAGWVEHDPIEIWRNTREVIGQALSKADMHLGDIAAVGITNQRETDRRLGPSHRRAGLQRHRLAGHPHPGDRRPARARTAASTGSRPEVGLPLATYFSGTKIVWILDNVDGAREQGRARRPAVRHDRHLGALEPHRRHRRRRARHRRDQRLPHHVDGPRDAVLGRRHPRRRSASRGRCCRRSAVRRRCTAPVEPSACSREVPIAGILGDQQAATFGQACVRRRRGEEHLRHRQLPAVQHRRPRSCQSRTACSRPSATSSATRTRALRAGGIDRRHRLARPVAARQPRHHRLRRRRSRSLAGSVEDNGGAYFVPAFSGLFAPYWRSDARGALVGLTRFVNKGAPGPRRAGGHRLPDA